MKRFFLILVFVLLAGALGWLWWDTRPAVRLSQSLGAVDVDPDESDSAAIIERIVVRDPVRPPKVPDLVVLPAIPSDSTGETCGSGWTGS